MAIPLLQESVSSGQDLISARPPQDSGCGGCWDIGCGDVGERGEQMVLMGELDKCTSEQN